MAVSRVFMVFAAVLMAIYWAAGSTLALSCGDAVSTMAPCGGYLMGMDQTNPTAQCCERVQSLARAASSAAQRKAICECFKQTAPSLGVKPQRVTSMLSFCKLPVSLPIGPNLDCSRA